MMSGALAAVFMTLPSTSSAIPYFARKYRTTCSRCHIAFPKLNTFGKNFQLHGYQQPGDSKVNKISYPEDPNLTLIDQLPIAFLVENQTQFDRVTGTDNQQIGQFCAMVRSKRPPEPYQGKGIRYVGEFVRKKAGKAAAKK